MSQVLTFLAGAGDCWADNGGAFNNNGNFMWIGGTSGIDYDPRAWIPFVLTFPKVTIVSATLKVRATITRGDSVHVQIGCEAADNPTAPASNGAVYGRVMTSAKLNASLAAYTTGNEYTYDVTASVQEVLNRAGWASGNTLAVIVKDNGTINDCRRTWASSENGTYPGPILEIAIPTFVSPTAGVI